MRFEQVGRGVLVLLVGCGSGEVTDLGVRDGGPARDAGEARDAGAVRDGGPRDGGPTIEPCVPGFVDAQSIVLPAQLAATPLAAKVIAEVNGFNVGVPFFYEQNREPASGIAGLRYGTSGGRPAPLFALLRPTRIIHGIFDHGSGRAVVYSGGVATDLAFDGVGVAFYEPTSTQPTTQLVQIRDDVRGVVLTSTTVEVLTQSTRTVRRARFTADDFESERFSIDSNRPVHVATVDGTAFIAYDAGDSTAARLGLLPLFESGTGAPITVELPGMETIADIATFGGNLAVLLWTGERFRLLAIDPVSGDLAWGAELDRSLLDGLAELATIDGYAAVAYWADGAPGPEVHLFDADLEPIAEAPFVPDVNVTGPRLGMSLAGGPDAFALTTSEGESGTAEHRIVFFDACAL